jgi:polyphosphate kinase 2
LQRPGLAHHLHAFGKRFLLPFPDVVRGRDRIQKRHAGMLSGCLPPVIGFERNGAKISRLAALGDWISRTCYATLIRSEAAMGKKEKRQSQAEIVVPDATADSIAPKKPKLKRAVYNAALADFQIELVKLQKWIQTQGLKVVIIFEGRDAAGKGGAIKRITQSLNPRVCRVEALAKPTERERTQWYFQRYAERLPAAGEMVCFDRSWYNRAGVERVMGFCTEMEYREFLRSCPQFERMLVRSGIILIKYWFSVSDEEQERRFQKRMGDPVRRWKLSPVDMESRSHWVDYSIAKDEMFAHTDIKQAPWYVVRGDDKRRARLNCIAHLLSLIPYQHVPEPKLSLPDRQNNIKYVRPPIDDQTFVPEVF